MDKILSKADLEKYLSSLKLALNNSEKFATAGKDAFSSLHKTFGTPFAKMSELLASDFFYYFVLIVIWIVILQIAWKFAIRHLYSLILRLVCCFYRQGITNYQYRD